MSDAVFTPMDMVKQRLQLTGGRVADCIMKVSREEGFRAFYASYRTSIIMNAPFTDVYLTIYAIVKKTLSRISSRGEGEGKGGENSLIHAAAGAAAVVSAAFFTTPLDVVMTQLQGQGVCGCGKYVKGSMRYVFGTVVKQDGYRGLMRGRFTSPFLQTMNVGVGGSISPNGVFPENDAGDSDSGTHSCDDIPDYYQPISSVAIRDGDDEDEEEEEETRHHYTIGSRSEDHEPLDHHGLSNGHADHHGRTMAMRMRSVDLSEEDAEMKEEQEELRAAEVDLVMRRAFEEDESRRNAPLTPENASRVMQAMRGVSFAGYAPDWAQALPEDQWIDQLRRLR
ncbi:Mitochondrial RNA-splicing protein MRS4-like protein [Drosera capensis]